MVKKRVLYEEAPKKLGVGLKHNREIRGCRLVWGSSLNHLRYNTANVRIASASCSGAGCKVAIFPFCFHFVSEDTIIELNCNRLTLMPPVSCY